MEITHETVTVTAFESPHRERHSALRSRMHEEGAELSTEVIVAELIQIAQERTDHNEVVERPRRRRFRRHSS